MTSRESRDRLEGMPLHNDADHPRRPGISALGQG